MSSHVLYSFEDEKIQEIMKNLKGIPFDVAEFLKKENFSHGEIVLLALFFEEKVIVESQIFDKESLQNLLEKEILQKRISGEETLYILDSIESFFTWIRKNATKKMDNIKDKTNIFIDLLRSSLGDSVKSKVIFYEGIEGIKDSYRHILNNAEKEICAYFSVIETVQPELQIFFENEYTPERARRKIFSRNITPKTPKTTYFSLQADEMDMEIRMVSSNLFPLVNSEINLYGDYMHCMVFDELGGFAVIIEGKDMVRLQKAIFELAWKACKNSSYMVKDKEVEDKNSRNFWEHFYPTDDIEFVLKQIEGRKEKYTPQLKEKWSSEKPEYITKKNGEKILKICGLEVMSDIEKPYMKDLAQNATMHGGNILNVGFGLGIVDTYIEEKRATRKIADHHIIELNHDVFLHAKKWKQEQKEQNKIVLHEGNWEVILPKLAKEGIVFDGIVYDAYPLELDEICRDVVRFLYSVIKLKIIKEKIGIITFFLDSTDGIGNSFQKYLQSLNINNIQISKILLESKKIPNYWEKNFFLSPLLTDIRY